MDASGGSSKNVTAVVEYDYAAKEPDELTLVKGAMITNIKQMPGGWWEGTLASSGKRGVFPDNFVNIQDGENSVVLRDKTSAIVRRCKVVFSYQENNNDELSLAVGDIIEVIGEVEEGWWRGKLNGKVGVFPSNFVEVIPTPSPISANRQTVPNNTSSIVANATNSLLRANKSNSSLNSSREDLLSVNNVSHDGYEAPSLPPKPIRETCKVLFGYDPANEDELKLVEGDIITIINKDLPDKGWWKGEIRGKIGVFPDNFVQLLPPEVTSPHKDTLGKPDRPPHAGKAALIGGSKQRRDSFGSKDSLSSEITVSPSSIARSATGPVFSAHRRSLEQKNNSEVSEKPPRKNLDLKNTDVRKSIENLEDKKATPPPVTKKPVVPIKKSPSITSVTNNLFSGLKSKVKGGSSAEKPSSHDTSDGSAGSKTLVADLERGNVVGEKFAAKTEEFDTVERSGMLADLRAGRAKAPRRRPPSSTQSLSMDAPQNGDHAPESPRQDPPEPAEGELVKPKATREWEKHRAPWMEELKASQAKKTSPGHSIAEPKSPLNHVSEVQEPEQSLPKSFSSTSFKSGAASNHQTITTTVDLRAQSVETKPPIDPMTKSLSAVSRISIHSDPKATSENHLVEPAARTRSISPRRQKVSLETGGSENLEERIAKLERVVVAQGATIEELQKKLLEEATNVKVLKMQLEKYAQCVTQV